MARILIADDEEAIRSLIARALRQDGHEVMTATDGAHALDVLGRERGGFELLLSDIRMPVMDGIALAHAAARAHPAVTILLMTGYADQRERAAGLDALVHDVISKPFSLGAMRRAVNEALTAPPRRAHSNSKQISVSCAASRRTRRPISPNRMSVGAASWFETPRTIGHRARQIRDRAAPHHEAGRERLWTKLIRDSPSVPIPKFASLCGSLVCELRNRRTLATY